MKSITCLLLVWTLGAWAQAPQPLSQVSFQSVTEWPHRQPDAHIAYGSDPLQFGWLWQAAKGPDKPLIVLVHGGCWLNAYGVDHTQALATALAAQGHAVWSLEYRRSGGAGGTWPGSLNDVKLALSEVDRLTPHGVATQELILMGHSAGGHLALLAAAETPNLKFKRVIGLAAITDITRYALGENSCQKATTHFMGGLPHEQPAAYHQANLLYRQLPDSVVLLQGEADQIVPVLHAQLHGVSSELAPGVGHFDWIHPDAAAFDILTRHLSNE